MLVQRTSVILVSLLCAHAGCSAHAPVPPQHAEPLPETAPASTLTVVSSVSLEGFTETLADGHVVGVLVRNDDQHDRVVVTGASAFRELRFVDAMGEIQDRLTLSDRPSPDPSCETMEGVLLRPGDTLRLAETFVEEDPVVSVIATFEVLLSQPGAGLPLSKRTIQFRAELEPPSPINAASASPPRISIMSQDAFLTADQRLMVGVRVRNEGATPLLIPVLSQLHAAVSVDDGELFPLVARSSPAACSLCRSGPGPSLCNGVEGVLLVPGESVTLAAAQDIVSVDSASDIAFPARGRYLLDVHSLICDVPTVRSAGEFSATVQPLR